MKRLISMMAFSFIGVAAFSQQDTSAWKRFTMSPESENFVMESKRVSIGEYMKEHNIFQHLDVSLTAGTPGVGIDVASPIGDYVQVRGGFEFMPRFTADLEFDLTINGKPVRAYDSQGNRIETSFDKMKEVLYQFTGYDVDDHVDMIGKPTLTNFKFLIDVFPFKNNKHWHFTAGFYWGATKFAEAVNSTESMVSLLSVGIYNQMYVKALKNEPLFDFSKIEGIDIPSVTIPALYEKLKSFGPLGFSVGTFSHDIYGISPEDIYDTDGNLVLEKGDYGLLFKQGEKYILQPDESSMVRVQAKSNAFKPYLGFGYGGRLIKGRDDWKVSFDCGAMFWGGKPELYTHDGIDLVNDVENIGGQVGRYVDLFGTFKVYPVLSFRLTKSIF